MIERPREFVAFEKQKARLEERRTNRQLVKSILGKEFVVNPGVYDTGLDTELMIESVEISPEETILEIGCGTGAVILSLADRAKEGLGTDINPLAVRNAKENAENLNINNIIFRESDLFKKVHGAFDVIVWNPPYSAYPAEDKVEMMFWDKNNAMKWSFFIEVASYLKDNGRIYFGWADFADIDVRLPYSLAIKNSFELRNEWSRKSDSGLYSFSVLEFAKAR